MKTIFIEENINRLRISKTYFKNNKIQINKKIENLNMKNKMKIVKKIKQLLEKEKIRQVAIEKKLKEDEQFINLLYSNNIKICSPKWIFKQYTDKIICKILKDKKKEESEIYICVNEVDSIVEKYIYKYAKEFKKINIITNHIGKFKKIEEKLYNEEGILINITNNRRKSLLKADLILNIDFPKELFNEFFINDQSVIINWDYPLKIRKKRFYGKIIEEIKIIVEEDSEIAKFIKENKLQKFDERDICQVLDNTFNLNFDINYAKRF